MVIIECNFRLVPTLIMSTHPQNSVDASIQYERTWNVSDITHRDREVFHFLIHEGYHSRYDWESLCAQRDA